MKRKKTDANQGFNLLRETIHFFCDTKIKEDGKVHSLCAMRIIQTDQEEHQARNVHHMSSQKTRRGRASHKTKALDQTVPKAYNSSTAEVMYKKLEPPTFTCRFCGATMWFEERTKKKTSLQNISFAKCCQDGKVRLPQLQPTPEPLRQLLSDQGIIGNNFRQKIRIYNSIFNFTSFGGRVDESINQTRGPYTFRISGQNYHAFGSLMPEEGVPPRYAQLYFYDTDNEVKNRMECMNLTTRDVHETVISGLVQMLDTHSCVAQAFRLARDWCAQNNPTDLKLKLIGERKAANRQYNRPTVSEVAALIVGDFGQTTAPRDIVVQTKTRHLQRISDLHPLYMALQYPLLFPYGEDGFHLNIPYHTNSGRRETKREYLTMREYYSYRIQQRLTEGTTVIQGGRLYQQYLVDAYCSMEEQRLRWARQNQDTLRADLYMNICDAVTKGDTEAASIGRRIVLPSSFTGGPRYMIQNYQDAMALCRALENPSLFITFTANPRWPEAEEMLSTLQDQKQSAHDRPDIMARLFKLKLTELMDDIQKNKIFGETRGVLYTIEFQKRGLPHAHILVWLHENYTAKTGREIDELISAEIPSKHSDPIAHTLVTEHMLHGPCGAGNKMAPCMMNGECNKHFPKSFYAETTVDEEGFPVYKRRNNGIHVKKGKNKLDNRYVVPYNRYLLVKYAAHINVEWCNKARAIKYLFKYINKGPDRATAMIVENDMQQDQSPSGKIVQVDEIKQYLECPYLSGCEAVWRIFAFDIHHSTPSVIRLTYHLPDQNTITLRDSQSLPGVLRRPNLKKTMFTEWFALNANDEDARKYTYAQIPKKYVWDSKEKEWTPRQSGTTIGRIVYTHPASGERYYLRMLLNVVKGPKSFAEIRTVNGKQYDTFKKTCYALGMLNDDQEWTDAIQEAMLWGSGDQLRQLFVTVLLFCDVSDPKKLWDSNWEALSHDVLYNKRKQYNFPNLQLTEHQIRNYCLLSIQDILSRHGKSLSDFPDLPMPDKTLLTKMDNRLIREELNYNCSEMAHEHNNLHGSLNADQLAVYSRVMTAVQKQDGGFFFVNGAGGTGKTFLYKTIISKLRSEKNIVLAVASSGIASLLLPGGRTAHSRFVIPLELMENSTCGINQNTNLAELIHEVKLIIWDEAPMTQKFAFEALDRTLRDIRGIKQDDNRQKMFGGIPVLLGGDFRQILPVIPKGRRQEIVQACISNSHLWRHCEVLTLSQSMRVREKDSTGNIDPYRQDFNKWVLNIGDGSEPAISIQDEEEPTWIEIPQQFLIEPGNDPIQQIIDHVFMDFKNNQSNTEYLQQRAILTPLNDDADEINRHMFELLTGLIKEYKSSDEICLASTDAADQEQLYPIEFLNGLNFPGMPPHNLRLKEGLPVMLLRNVNPSQGLCNGTRLIVHRLGEWVVDAEIITGSNAGERVLIPRITMTSTKSKWPFVLKRRQFPIKPCFAMTINKSQGQTLNYVGLYLPKPVFCHGQLYVAISRVTNPKGLKMLIRQSAGHPPNRTRNIVYKEAFNGLKHQA